mgnify:FL=1
MQKKKKYKRKHIPKFKKFYKINPQDEFLIEKEALLQKIYTKIADEFFSDFKNYCFGDWQINFNGIILYIDPVLGNQAEVFGTSNLPLLKRLKIHIRLLKLLRKGYTKLKAVKLCLLAQMKQ